MNDLDDDSRFQELYREYEQILDDVVDLFEQFETLSYEGFAQYISESVEDFTPTKKNLRICCLAYDYLLSKMQLFIKQDTGIDMLNEIDHGLWVSPKNMGAIYVYNQHAIDVIKNMIMPKITSYKLRKDMARFVDIISKGMLTSRME